MCKNVNFASLHKVPCQTICWPESSCQATSRKSRKYLVPGNSPIPKTLVVTLKTKQTIHCITCYSLDLLIGGFCCGTARLVSCLYTKLTICCLVSYLLHKWHQSSNLTHGNKVKGISFISTHRCRSYLLPSDFRHPHNSCCATLCIGL